jgi:hypothetical protein
MENKSTANKWLIAAVIVMGIIIVAMATWIIAGAVVYKNSDSNSSVKTSQTKKDSSDSLEKTRGEGEEPSNETKKEYKDFRTKGDGTGIRLTSASDIDKLDIDSSLNKFLKSKVGQPIVRKIINQSRRLLARFSVGQIARIILNPFHKTSFLQHFQIIFGTLAQPLRL